MKTYTPLLVLLAGCFGAPEWPKLKQDIRHKYPDVEQISPEALHEWLEDESRTPPTLLDVRKKDEFAVSHLPGARWVEPGTPVSSIEGLDPSTPIVVYCAVGYRSSKFATKLDQAGFHQIANLEGSIFEWANRGYSVYQGDEEVKEVHPFNQEWGRLLREDRRSFWR